MEITTSIALISPELNIELIENVISQAKEENYYSIISTSYWSKKIVRDLKETSITHSCIVSYPYGSQLTEVKVFEAETAIELGAKEIILSVNSTAIKSAAFEWVKIEIARLAHFTHSQEIFLGIYLDTEILTDKEISTLLSICQSAGADYILIPYEPAVIEQAFKLIGEHLGIRMVCDKSQLIDAKTRFPFLEGIVIKN